MIHFDSKSRVRPSALPGLLADGGNRESRIENRKEVGPSLSTILDSPFPIPAFRCLLNVADNDDDQCEEADQLNEQERKADGHHGTGLWQANVHERLHHTTNQHTDRREVRNRSAGAADLKREHDGREHRKILDTVRVSTHRALVPVRSFRLIGGKSIDWRASGEDQAPPVHADRCLQQQYRPDSESQAHPDRYRHGTISTPCGTTRVPATKTRWMRLPRHVLPRCDRRTKSTTSEPSGTSADRPAARTSQSRRRARRPAARKKAFAVAWPAEPSSGFHRPRVRSRTCAPYRSRKPPRSSRRARVPARRVRR